MSDDKVLFNRSGCTIILMDDGQGIRVETERPGEGAHHFCIEGFMEALEAVRKGVREHCNDFSVVEEADEQTLPPWRKNYKQGGRDMSPPVPEGTLVDVRHNDGRTWRRCSAGKTGRAFNWSHDEDSGIEYWRPVNWEDDPDFQRRERAGDGEDDGLVHISMMKDEAETILAITYCAVSVALRSHGDNRMRFTSEVSNKLIMAGVDRARARMIKEEEITVDESVGHIRFKPMTDSFTPITQETVYEKFRMGERVRVATRKESGGFEHPNGTFTIDKVKGTILKDGVEGVTEVHLQGDGPDTWYRINEDGHFASRNFPRITLVESE